ncbi:hypothetical protein PAXRUDRAFT_36931 [Paxillus rubicundulus Ve08.2h10]|uniref:Uncharacterized protein n=1 Tax=Paxillus rubicundulus Ve08.2h10 TaxID=930991 RepID=A0A0D0CYF2_9AGAM|nr:hypothetical protein PAXRUDRAFT_36931 [Paxillus rubicundulus Ve08.2h10]
MLAHDEEIFSDPEDGSGSDDPQSDGTESGNDFEEMRRVLVVPGPTAAVIELWKRIPTIEDQIILEVRKYTIFYHFGLLDSLFLPSPKPNVNIRGPLHFKSPEGRVDGAKAELYEIIPESLHSTMEEYKQFDSVFCTAINAERSNILRVIKDCTLILFTDFQLDPRLFIDGEANRKDAPALLHLLRVDSSKASYDHIAPILFLDPTAMNPEDFLKSPILMNGKSSLGDRGWQGRPSARGQHVGALSITEGLIAGAAILVSSEGRNTKIPYQQDFEFHVELLYKRNMWAIGVMNHYNHEVFGLNSTPAASTTPPSAPPTATVAWEDNFLDKLENPRSSSPPVPNITISTMVVTTASPPGSPLIAAPTMTSTQSSTSIIESTT